MKTYFIFALLCVADPESSKGISCFNFWEDSKTYSASKCYERAAEVGDEIATDFKENDLKIMEHIIWCVNSRGKVI